MEFLRIRRKHIRIGNKFDCVEGVRWGWVFFKWRLQNYVCRFGCGLAGLFSQQILLNLIKRCNNQHAEIFMNETNMRLSESVFTNRIFSSWHQKTKISKRIVLIENMLLIYITQVPQKLSKLDLCQKIKYSSWVITIDSKPVGRWIESQREPMPLISWMCTATYKLLGNANVMFCLKF